MTVSPDGAGGREWAIVTNGKRWRIYAQRTESRAANFYQVDLEEALADTDPMPSATSASTPRRSGIA